MKYSANDVANYVLTYCTQKDKPISNLKLQKMLYFIWIDYFKETKLELFFNEIYAWQLGPVVPDVYYEYCSYAGTDIFISIDSKITDNDEIVLNSIIEKYIDLTPYELVNKSHAQDKPWSVIYNHGLGIRDLIPFSLIKKLECGYGDDN